MMSFLLTVLYFTCFSLSQKGPCVEEREDGCCSGTSWNSTLQKCTDCFAGFFGINCKERCEFPHYGMQCANECSCAKIDCDFASGCLKKDSDLVQGWSTAEKNINTEHPSSNIATTVSSSKSKPLKKGKTSFLQIIVITCGSLFLLISVIYGLFTLCDKTVVESVQQPGDGNKPAIYEDIQ